MTKQSLLLIIAVFSLSFSGCSKKDFSVSEKIDISTTKETIDDNYDKLNELVLKINEQHLLQEVQLKFPNATKPFIQVGVSKTKTSIDLPGKTEETFSLKVNLSMRYDQRKDEEAAAILKFYKELYSDELRKLNVPLRKTEKVVSS